MPFAASAYRILFVCTGNTCRSPLAAVALRAELGRGDGRVEVMSAGTSARDGEPASEGSVAVAADAGLDLRAHRSRALTTDLARGAELVLVMEPRHRDAVADLGVPAERIHVLSEWPEPGEPGLPVEDPFGGSIEAYEECWRRIRRHVRRLVPQVIQAARARAERGA